MKTTNILLGVIAILLFFSLIKGTAFNFIPQASAQTRNADQPLKVKIVDVDPKVKFEVETVTVNGRHILPVYIVDSNGHPVTK